MAVRRLKGLYLKSEGKYLEDHPSCYVEQTEALFEWRQSTPKQDIELHKRAEKFSGLFRDMLLDKDAIENVKLFEDAAFFSPTAFTSAQQVLNLVALVQGELLPRPHDGPSTKTVS